ncbi:MAG: HEAT repeat domain-containing protein [Candidatus Thorarchaeota archaeon]
MSETRRMLLDFLTEEVGVRARSNSAVRQALVKAISDTSDIVRQRALIATLELADPTIVKDVVQALKDDEEEVRIAAAEVLAWYQQPSTIPTLVEGLKDPSTWVRSHCANGLSKLIAGPIWARLSKDSVDKILADFPEMDEEQIRSFLLDIKVRPKQIDRFMKWRKQNYEVEIDTSIIEAMESGPIILEGAEMESPILSKPTGISPEVEEILSELPDEIRETLPEEDLRRLTPNTARELVNSLLAAAPSKKDKELKKKTVKVTKVKKVKKRTGPSKEDLLEQIPEEVKASLPEDVLEGLSIEELEAVVASSSEIAPMAPVDEGVSVPEKEAPKKEKPKKTKESEDDVRISALIEKYGEEKAKILSNIPEEMLAGIPEDQIQEMDIDSLKDLADALEPR